jgi:hypothetical protein
MMEIDYKPGDNVLVTCDDWFFAPDGNSYKAAWGPTWIMPAKDLVGFAPKNTAEWYVVVGRGQGGVVLAGCRVHYAVRTDRKPLGNSVYVPAEALRERPSQ